MSVDIESLDKDIRGTLSVIIISALHAEYGQIVHELDLVTSAVGTVKERLDTEVASYFTDLVGENVTASISNEDYAKMFLGYI